MVEQKPQQGLLPVPVSAMQNLITQRKDLIVKIGDAYEVSRPLALELWKMLVEEIVRAGGSIRETSRVEYASVEMVVVVSEVEIKVGESVITLSEVGEAYAKEKGKEFTLARTAYTRAMKRLLERIAGEDFINQVILSLFPQKVKEAPASEKQKEYIRKLVSDGKLTKEHIDSLIAEGRLPEGFVLGKALENGLTSSQASAIISKVKGDRS